MKLVTTPKGKRRKPGDLFHEVTGQSVADVASVREVERAVENALGHKLTFQYSNSNVVPRRGDVFPHIEASMDKVDSKIDKFLKKS